MQVRALVHPRSITLAIIGIVLIVFLAALLDAFVHLEKYEAKSSTSYLHVRWAVSLLAAACLGALIIRVRTSPGPLLEQIVSWLPVRAAAYVVFLAITITTVADVEGVFEDSSFRLQRFFENTLLAGLALWALAVLGFPRTFGKAPKSLPGFLDLAIWNLLVVTLLIEGILTFWARYSHSPFFWNTGAIEANIQRFRPGPDYRFYDFTFNSAGYHDQEFFRGEEGDLVVAVLADSFGVGIVPYDYNFVTVAERHLQEALKGSHQRVAVHNFGISSIGVPEYLYLLDTEVMDTNPALVVLVAFVGNDIGGDQPSEDRPRQSFRNWWIWTFGKRVWAVLGPNRHTVAVGMIGTPTPSGGPVPDFISDPSKEKPHFSEEKFLEIESIRMEFLNPNNQAMERRYEEFLQALDLFKARLADRLLLVLIPDEFQVNDALYEWVLATKNRPEAYERDRPQRIIGAYARRAGIPVLDLLPALRTAEEQVHTYHLRDTHWNARGNRVAGEEIADFILGHLEQGLIASP